MDPLIDLIRNNPILVVFLGIWLLSIFGNVLTKAARKAAEQQRRQAQKRAQVDPGQRPLLPQQQPRQTPVPARRAPAPTRARPPAPTKPAAPTAEDIAAEIRRVMGLEEPPRRAPVTEPPPPPPPEEPGFTTQAGFEHFGEKVGGLHSGVDPHVGEGVSTRHTPGSGAVGQRKLGSLGGRVHRTTKAVTRRKKRFDLSDPAAVFVTLEILGKPRALRGFDF